MFELIKAWTSGTLSPHLPSLVHCADTGSQRNTNPMQKPIPQAASTTIKKMDRRWMNVVTNTRMKKHSMDAFITANMVTYSSDMANTT